MLCGSKSAKLARVPIPFGLSSGCCRLVLPDTTTIALIARAANRAARVCVRLATSCFPPHRAAYLPER
jgi:hypothetical protein